MTEAQASPWTVRRLLRHRGFTTFPPSFPTMNPIQPANGGYGDAFVTKIPMLAATKTMLTSSFKSVHLWTGG